MAGCSSHWLSAHSPIGDMHTPFCQCLKCKTKGTSAMLDAHCKIYLAKFKSTGTSYTVQPKLRFWKLA